MDRLTTEAVGPGLPEVDLEAMRERARRATQGPWTFRVQTLRHAQYDQHDDTVMIGAVAPGHQIRATPRGGTFPSSDGEFIAHARQDVPDLIAEVERLRAALAEAGRSSLPGNRKEVMTRGKNSKTSRVAGEAS